MSTYGDARVRRDGLARAWHGLTGLVVVYPVARLAFALMRGPIVDFYPYPFMDVRAHGYRQVLLECLAVAVLFVGLAVRGCVRAGKVKGALDGASGRWLGRRAGLRSLKVKSAGTGAPGRWLGPRADSRLEHALGEKPLWIEDFSLVRGARKR